MLPAWRRFENRDEGETLIEVLVAVVIMGLVGVAVVAGLMLAATASDIHRKETTSGAYVRSYAEAIQNYVSQTHLVGGVPTTNYQPCAAHDSYTPALVGFSVPTGYRASQSAALAVSPTGGTVACPTADTGVQLVTLTLTSADNRATQTLAVILREACDPSVAPCT